MESGKIFGWLLIVWFVIRFISTIPQLLYSILSGSIAYVLGILSLELIWLFGGIYLINKDWWLFRKIRELSK